MNIFTANQVNQVYVLKADSTIVELGQSNDVTKAENALGTIGVGKTADKKNIYFKHLGAGGVTRSDLIPVDSIMHIAATPASKMETKLQAVKVTLNSEALSSSNPIAGEDYILRIKFQNPVGMSPDNQYWKYGAVHATSGMTPAKFYATMACSLAKNMSRDAVQLIKVSVVASGTPTEVTATTKVDSLTGSYDGILIEAVDQPWILGIKQQKPLIFSVEPDLIDNGTDEVVWGDVVYSDNRKLTGGVAPAYSVVTSGAPTATTVVNSKLMADYEYFYMGEKADQYRMVGWPDYIPTEYLVNPKYVHGYDTIGIHFAYTGSNHAVQKSEKDITIIVPRANTDNASANLKKAIGAKAQNLLDAINAAIAGEDSTASS